MQVIGSLRNDVFERRMPNGSGLLAILEGDVDQIFGQINSMREKDTCDIQKKCGSVKAYLKRKCLTSG